MASLREPLQQPTFPPTYQEVAGKGVGEEGAGLPVLFSRDQIAERVRAIGAQIDNDLQGEGVILAGVLKGAAIFLADLARSIRSECTFDFVAVSSYGKGTRSSGAVKLIKDLDQAIEGKNIILVEDILDTGLTISFLKKLLMQHHPHTLRVATLLDKPERRQQQIAADYVGFEIPDHFVVGYGMDYAERFRNLPDICILPPERITERLTKNLEHG
jgi:hypoxanthine phosphoribosyltransferase